MKSDATHTEAKSGPNPDAVTRHVHRNGLSSSGD